MSDRPPTADSLRFDLNAIEETGHHGRVDNLPTADGTVPGHVSLGLMNGWHFPDGLAIDNVPTEGTPIGLTGMPFDVYPPQLDANMNGLGGGLDPFGASHGDAFGMGHLHGPNPLDAFSLPQHPLSSSGESTPTTSSSLTLRDDQAPGLKLEMTPAGTFEPHTLPNAAIPLHLPVSGAPMMEPVFSSPDWHPAANPFPFFDQSTVFGDVQQLPHLAFPPGHAMQAPGTGMPDSLALGTSFRLPAVPQVDAPMLNQGMPDIPLPAPAPPADVPPTVKDRATPIQIAMTSLEQVAALAATHLPPLPKVRSKRSRARRGTAGPNSAQTMKKQRGRPKRDASAGKAAPKSTKAKGRKAGAKHTGKTKSSLSRASRPINITKPTNSTYVKPCSPNSKHQCRFDGCTIRCYDRRTLQRHERTHFRADADTYFCPGLYITRECEDSDIQIEGCTCPPWGYSREDALLRHLRNILGKEWEGYDDPCVQAAMIMGWDPVIRSSVQRLRPYKPQPPED